MSKGTPTGKQHGFPFEGGDVLDKMGAAWFVSYAYSIRKDPAHKNWSRIATTKMRAAFFEKTLPYHRFWLYKILHMDDKRLNRNTIGMTAAQVKQMAHELLDMFW